VFEPTALLNQELDLMPTQEKRKPFYPKTKYYSITGQKMWISNAGFCSLFIVFARIEMIKYYWFHHRK
jgi:alkylation response protein AidB-like acyl-CoA dehydrogenase